MQDNTMEDVFQKQLALTAQQLKDVLSPSRLPSTLMAEGQLPGHALKLGLSNTVVRTASPAQPISYNRMAPTSSISGISRAAFTAHQKHVPSTPNQGSPTPHLAHGLRQAAPQHQTANKHDDGAAGKMSMPQQLAAQGGHAHYTKQSSFAACIAACDAADAGNNAMQQAPMRPTTSGAAGTASNSSVAPARPLRQLPPFPASLHRTKPISAAAASAGAPITACQATPPTQVSHTLAHVPVHPLLDASERAVDDGSPASEPPPNTTSIPMLSMTAVASASSLSYAGFMQPKSPLPHSDHAPAEAATATVYIPAGHSMAGAVRKQSLTTVGGLLPSASTEQHEAHDHQSSTHNVSVLGPEPELEPSFASLTPAIAVAAQARAAATVGTSTLAAMSHGQHAPQMHADHTNSSKDGGSRSNTGWQNDSGGSTSRGSSGGGRSSHSSGEEDREQRVQDSGMQRRSGSYRVFCVCGASSTPARDTKATQHTPLVEHAAPGAHGTGSAHDMRSGSGTATSSTAHALSSTSTLPSPPLAVHTSGAGHVRKPPCVTARVHSNSKDARGLTSMEDSVSDSGCSSRSSCSSAANSDCSGLGSTQCSLDRRGRPNSILQLLGRPASSGSRAVVLLSEPGHVGMHTQAASSGGARERSHVLAPAPAQVKHVKANYGQGPTEISCSRPTRLQASVLQTGAADLQIPDANLSRRSGHIPSHAPVDISACAGRHVSGLSRPHRHHKERQQVQQQRLRLDVQHPLWHDEGQTLGCSSPRRGEGQASPVTKRHASLAPHRHPHPSQSPEAHRMSCVRARPSPLSADHHRHPPSTRPNVKHTQRQSPGPGPSTRTWGESSRRHTHRQSPEVYTTRKMPGRDIHMHAARNFSAGAGHAKQHSHRPMALKAGGPSQPHMHLGASCKIASSAAQLLNRGTGRSVQQGAHAASRSRRWLGASWCNEKGEDSRGTKGHGMCSCSTHGCEGARSSSGSGSASSSSNSSGSSSSSSSSMDSSSSESNMAEWVARAQRILHPAHMHCSTSSDDHGPAARHLAASRDTTSPAYSHSPYPRQGRDRQSQAKAQSSSQNAVRSLSSGTAVGASRSHSRAQERVQGSAYHAGTGSGSKEHREPTGRVVIQQQHQQPASYHEHTGNMAALPRHTIKDATAGSAGGSRVRSALFPLHSGAELGRSMQSPGMVHADNGPRTAKGTAAGGGATAKGTAFHTDGGGGASATLRSAAETQSKEASSTAGGVAPGHKLEIQAATSGGGGKHAGTLAGMHASATAGVLAQQMLMVSAADTAAASSTAASATHPLTTHAALDLSNGKLFHLTVKRTA